MGYKLVLAVIADMARCAECSSFARVPQVFHPVPFFFLPSLKGAPFFKFRQNAMFADPFLISTVANDTADPFFRLKAGLLAALFQALILDKHSMTINAS